MFSPSTSRRSRNDSSSYQQTQAPFPLLLEMLSHREQKRDELGACPEQRRYNSHCEGMQLPAASQHAAKALWLLDSTETLKLSVSFDKAENRLAGDSHVMKHAG